MPMVIVLRDIARNYLPRKPHYWYARIKLATDPLYTGVGAVLAETCEPLLDLGCGTGLLGVCLGQPSSRLTQATPAQPVSARSSSGTLFLWCLMRRRPKTTEGVSEFAAS